MTRELYRKNGWTEYAVLQSETETGTSYRIDRRDATGELRCQCKGFIFTGARKAAELGRTGKTCKHLLKLEKFEAHAKIQPAGSGATWDTASAWMAEILAAGRIVPTASALSKMVLLLATRLADYAPAVPGIAATEALLAGAAKSVAVSTTGVRVITFDDFD